MRTRKLVVGAVILALIAIVAYKLGGPTERSTPGSTAQTGPDSRDVPKTPGLIPRPGESRPESRPAASEAGSREVCVVDRHGGPLYLAQLSLADSDEDCTIEVIGPGVFLLRGRSAGSVRVLVTDRHYFPAERLVTLGTGCPPLFIAPASATELSILVLESGTGKVVPDAALRLTAALPGQPPFLWSGRTDRYGAATYPRAVLMPAFSSVVLQVSAPAHVPVTRTILRPSAREVIHLDPGRAVEVSVHDARSHPVSGAAVRCASLSEVRSATSFHGAVPTDARGNATVFANVGERALATVSAEGWQPAAVAIAADRDRVDVELSRPRPAGIILKSPAGAVLAGVRVSWVPFLGGQGGGPSAAEGSEAVTNADGVALLDNHVPTVDYLVVFHESPVTPRFTTVVKAAGLEALAAVVAPVPRKLEISVRSTAGTPIAGARVCFVPERESTVGERQAPWVAPVFPVTTGSRGAATLLIAAEAPGHVVAAKPGFAPAATPVGPDAAHVIALDPGTPLDVRVVDQNGARYAGATVVLEAPVMTAGTPVRIPPAWRPHCEQRATTWLDGECSLVALATRSLLHAECANDVKSARELTAEEIVSRKAVIVLTRSEEKTLFVVDSDGVRIAAAAVISRVEGWGSSMRALRVSDEGGAVVLPVPVPLAGDQRQVTFTFGGAARGEHACRLADVRDGMQIQAARARSRQVRVTLTDPNRSTDLALESVRYAVAGRLGSALGSSGVLDPGVESAVEVPDDGADYVLQLSWDSGPAIHVPIPAGRATLAVKLPPRFRIPITNASAYPVEVFVTDLGRGQLWRAPILSPGGSASVDCNEDFPHHSVEVDGLPREAVGRVSFKASETARIVVDSTGVKAVSQ